MQAHDRIHTLLIQKQISTDLPLLDHVLRLHVKNVLENFQRRRQIALTLKKITSSNNIRNFQCPSLSNAQNTTVRNWTCRHCRTECRNLSTKNISRNSICGNWRPRNASTRKRIQWRKCLSNSQKLSFRGNWHTLVRNLWENFDSRAHNVPTWWYCAWRLTFTRKWFPCNCLSKLTHNFSKLSPFYPTVKWNFTFIVPKMCY